MSLVSNIFVDAPEHQCLGKYRHATKEKAKLAIRRMTCRRGNLHAYRCAHCGAFHVGHRA